LGWPVAAVVICLFFHRPLAGVIKELTAFLARASQMSVRRGDTTVEAKVDAHPQTQNTGDDIPDAKLGAGSAITSNRSSESDDLAREREAAIDYGKGIQSVAILENAINTELERLRFLPAEIETSEMLIRQLAASQCVAGFERTYRLIYGSQLQALDFLNTSGVQDASWVSSIFFDTAKAIDETFYGDSTFEQWSAFLLNQSLIAQEGDSLGITVRGRDFLVWMVNAGLTHAKLH
jgi:hypothetical protein